MTSIKYDFSFLAGFFTDGEMQLNNYNLHLHLYINTESDIDQQTAFDRMNLMMYDIVDNCIFIEETDCEINMQLGEAGIRVLTIPAPGPIDQIIQVALVDKLNKITEDKLHIFESELSSLRGGYVKYMYFSPEEHDSEMELISSDARKWWNSSSPRFNSSNETKEIVNFMPTLWKTLELEWENEIDDEIIYTDSNKKNTNIITMKLPDEN